MRRLKEKDEAALLVLMEQYGDELLRTAYLLVKDHQTAEEAVQDTFVQAYRSIGQLQDPSRLRSWLMRIVINCCRTRMRTWSWRKVLPWAWVEQLAEDQGRYAAPEEQLVESWGRERLSVAIRSLDYMYREVIVLYYYQEMSVLEIAAHTGCKENTVKARLARGRLRLRKIWEREEEADV
ncbi:sigma-70 family RNA polymerase sigma factor [Paenibacillus filicis]|uniref:Sigma-70 family RNA polymerase sigma factor n=1 Tax=Paenibacillus filicis TaxID=669464 RepID=A0ABU9DJR1_9BACL